MPSILIVDDYAPNRTLLAAMLATANHRVTEATDGMDGLAKLRDEQFDLVVCDIFMPNMDGYEFVHIIRSDPALAATRVVFWTKTLEEPETRALADACGVTRILAKPLMRAEALRIVDLALADPRQLIPEEPGVEPGRDALQMLVQKLSKKMQVLKSQHTGRPVRPVLW